MIQSVLSNIAVILLMHFCIENYKAYARNRRSKPIQVSIGIVAIVSAASIAMLYLPITYNGYRFDLRAIPLVFLASLRGGKEALPALILVSAWRFGMGGEGAVPGVLFGMVLPTLFSLRFNAARRFVLFSSVWAISDVPIIFIVPDGWRAFLTIFPVRYLSFLLAAYILYVFIRSSCRQQKMQERLLFLAERDPLTELYNVRKFFECAQQASQSAVPGYIVLLDVDYFKNINDTYGHLTGDIVLKQLAAILRERCKEIDRDACPVFVGRYGGEEFILYISTPNDRNVSCFLENVRQEVESTTFLAEDGVVLPRITVSIGAAKLLPPFDLKRAVLVADTCLYKVKEQGRNGICMYE